MGNPKAFLTIPRQEAGYRPIHDRISDYSEVEQTLNSRDRKLQASRCMDCGVPFCHWACPLGNKQPEFQDALYKGKWEEAYKILNETNDFPEFTGRICPALCEKSCVLKLSMDSPVTIRENEAAIAEAAFREGYIKPRNIERNGRKVAIIGAGPAGLAAANQLNGKGYTVTVFDKNEAPGGLLRYGIPNFKLHKPIIDRRIRVMEEEGIHFKMNNDVDVLQIPAFLCRQTDLLVAAAHTGKIVNIKKGQFLSPGAMRFAADKVVEAGNDQVMLTERGTTFGYQDLIVDYRGIPEMQTLGFPVILDVTHSLQQPNQTAGVTGGMPQLIETVAKAGIAVGVDGLFMETHEDPSVAKSDGANMLKLDLLEGLLTKLVRIRQVL